jgi:hypothetical protein
MKKNALLSALSAIALTAGVGVATIAHAQTAAETAAYESAIASGDAGSLRSFLAAYPSSPYARDVFQRLNGMSRSYQTAKVSSIDDGPRESRGGDEWIYAQEDSIY